MTPQNILFVDDSPMVLSLLERTLTQEAFTLHTAHTPKEALQVLEQHPIDVVVSDLLMPGLDGITFLRMIKKDYPHIVRIILSGHLHTQSILSAINQVGVFRFLTKPLELDDDTLKKYCMRRLIRPNSTETACMQNRT
uniref:Response regulator n=1 Tax=Paenibacillus polymyxa TaxID=1406 RepID=A0AAE9THH3_PAEPO